MKTSLLITTVLSLIVVKNAASQSDSLPAWTSRDNRTILARFVGVGPQTLLIEKDGALFTVPFARLSEASIAQARRMGGIDHLPVVSKPLVSRERSLIASRAASPPIRALASISSHAPVVADGRGRLPSQPEWSFLHAYRVGDDIVVPRALATVFGHDTSLGVKDPNDNGRCASGRGTMANPGILGCALPVSLARRSTLGSPFARLTGLPWFSQVVVTHKDKSVTVQLIDNGPSAPSSGDKIPAGIDLTPAACAALGIPLEDLRENRAAFPVSFRLRGAGRLVAMN